MKYATSEKLGTHAWGMRNRGILNAAEIAQIYDNIAFLQRQEHLDAERRRLGLLNPVHIDVETLLPPDSRLTADALVYAQETHSTPLLHHSWRTYFFGALIAKHDGIDYDPELFFSAAILHDLALTDHGRVPPLQCCFAVSGADQAHEHLVACGHQHGKVEVIADAIALHLNLHVPLEDYGPTAFLTARGAVCDVMSPGLSRISAQSAREVLIRHPREGLSDYFALDPAQHLLGTRPALITTVLLSSGEKPQHPLDSGQTAFSGR